LLLAAWWLWHRQPWGDVLAGLVLVKAATMGLALLAMTAFARDAGLPIDAVLSIAWIALAAAGLCTSLLFFRRCRHTP
jgi:hypothetical protein